MWQVMTLYITTIDIFITVTGQREWSVELLNFLHIYYTHDSGIIIKGCTFMSLGGAVLIGPFSFVLGLLTFQDVYSGPLNCT